MGFDRQRPKGGRKRGTLEGNHGVTHWGFLPATNRNRFPVQTLLLTMRRQALGFPIWRSVPVRICPRWFCFSLGDIQNCLGLGHVEVCQENEARSICSPIYLKILGSATKPVVPLSTRWSRCEALVGGMWGRETERQSSPGNKMMQGHWVGIHRYKVYNSPLFITMTDIGEVPHADLCQPP